MKMYKSNARYKKSHIGILNFDVHPHPTVLFSHPNKYKLWISISNPYGPIIPQLKYHETKANVITIVFLQYARSTLINETV